MANTREIMRLVDDKAREALRRIGQQRYNVGKVVAATPAGIKKAQLQEARTLFFEGAEKKRAVKKAELQQKLRLIDDEIKDELDKYDVKMKSEFEQVNQQLEALTVEMGTKLDGEENRIRATVHKIAEELILSGVTDAVRTMIAELGKEATS